MLLGAPRVERGLSEKLTDCLFYNDEEDCEPFAAFSVREEHLRAPGLSRMDLLNYECNLAGHLTFYRLPISY